MNLGRDPTPQAPGARSDWPRRTPVGGAVIPRRQNQRPDDGFHARFDREAHRQRNRVERVVNRPKQYRLGKDDPKIQFHDTIKDIEHRLGDATVSLSSFIVSNTPSHTMRQLWGMGKPDMRGKNILFQDEDKDNYVRSMLESADSGRAAR